MRTPIIAGNWKLNKTISEAVDLVSQLRLLVEKGPNGVEVIVAPTFPALSAVSKTLEDSSISVAAQDLYWEEKGAFTGEVSASLIVDSGCSHVIIGHSERRQYFGETNQSVNRKAKSALNAGLIPIICVGEMLEDREAGKTEQVVKDHLVNSIAKLTEEQILNSVIAYEPVWAIGTGKTATPDQAQEVHALIRSVLSDTYSSANVADRIRIQYGGSVTPANAVALLSQPDVDGALVGGASLEAEPFADIVKAAQP